MFRGEATVLASLDAPNVVRLYEYVESPSGAAIVMELIGGVSLREILTYQGKTTAEAALVVLQGSLLGLAAAHRRGIVHRDYKPENVLVNGDGISKLADFGIAARTGDHPIPAGTMLYAAPEQMASTPAGPAGDIYAATATFYECLTGRPALQQGKPTRCCSASIAESQYGLEQGTPAAPAPGGRRDGQGPEEPADRRNHLRLGPHYPAASSAYEQHWREHGPSHLGEATLLLAALWPSGPPPAAQGTTVQQVPLSPACRAAAHQRGQGRHRGQRRNHSRGRRHGARRRQLAAACRLRPGPGLPASPSQRSGQVLLQPSPSSSSPSSRPASPATHRVADHITAREHIADGPGKPSANADPQHAAPRPGYAGNPASPKVASVGTYTQGALVYFDIRYTRPRP